MGMVWFRRRQYESDVDDEEERDAEPQDVTEHEEVPQDAEHVVEYADDYEREEPVQESTVPVAAAPAEAAGDERVRYAEYRGAREAAEREATQETADRMEGEANYEADMKAMAAAKQAEQEAEDERTGRQEAFDRDVYPKERLEQEQQKPQEDKGQQKPQEDESRRGEIARLARGKIRAAAQVPWRADPAAILGRASAGKLRSAPTSGRPPVIVGTSGSLGKFALGGAGRAGGPPKAAKPTKPIKPTKSTGAAKPAKLGGVMGVGGKAPSIGPNPCPPPSNRAMHAMFDFPKGMSMSRPCGTYGDKPRDMFKTPKF